MDKKPVYIMSLEASDIYYHQHREMQLKREYLGMIPFSLELLKLQDVGLKTTYIEQRDKYISNDIINVKFNSKVRNADEMVEIYKKRLNYAKNDKTAINLQEYIELLEYHSSKSDYDDEYWDDLGLDGLREKLYSDGFEITFKNSRTGTKKTQQYVVYKRSSAKSRTGQCLFIKKKLHSKMMKWSRMGLNLRKGQIIDLASLLAYESLVGSSLENVININPDNILIVDDIESKFKEICNVVRTRGKKGLLDSFEEEAEVNNSLFDGESLLESSYFPDGYAMILLRNHMFKSASFNTNIQKFLVDNCPKDINYNDWEIVNMYGERMFAKDIHMICTPSSVKALKFAHTMPNKTDAEMWKHWKTVVKEDGNLFGVCKYEKKSKLGFDEEGNTLQQTSYQMINCLPASPQDINELTKTEKNYIMRLKNDDNFLMDEIYKKRDDTNSNEVIYKLYKHNSNIIKTKIFKKFKREFVNRQVSHAKKGKIKIKGDYCVLLGNPIEFLFHSIGKWDGNSTLGLEGNQVYTKLYKADTEMIGFRNPNTSPSNVLIMENKESKFIDNYFNLSANIIVVNAINFPIQDILSGCDYDSDTMLVSAEDSLVKIGKKCFRHYRPCVNHIASEKKKYYLTEKDHYEIDKQLSHSQFNIGKVVNLGQFSMSTYWDLINNGETGDHVDELLKKVDVMTILSGIAIDMAKKFYAIDMDAEIAEVEKNVELNKRKKKPLFWVNVSQNKNVRNKVARYECPMDYLIESMSNIEQAKHVETVELDDLINDYEIKKVDTRQVKKVKGLIEKYNNSVIEIFSHNKDKDTSLELVNIAVSDTLVSLKSLKLKEATIAYIIKETYNDGDSFLLRVLKLLNESHFEKLYNVVKKI